MYVYTNKEISKDEFLSTFIIKNMKPKKRKMIYEIIK